MTGSFQVLKKNEEQPQRKLAPLGHHELFPQTGSGEVQELEVP